MGLDSYLSAERYFWFNEPKPEHPDVPEGFEIKAFTVEVAYWRKANQIHRWFVENVQDYVDDCRSYFVPHEKLQELRDLCILALETQDPNLLPPQSGFFFGSTDIDEWYWSNLRSTVEQIDKALASFPEDKWDFEYRASW